MKRLILAALTLVSISAATATAQTVPYPFPATPFGPSAQQYNPYAIPSTPWMARGPGMGNYGFKGFAPGSGFGYGAAPSPPVMPMDPGYYNLGPGAMMSQGMMQFGMGPGMIRGIGAMGYISSEAFQKFFDETRELRKELNGLMFDYAEMLRQKEQNPAERVKLENRIMELRQKVYDKAPRYQYPFE